MSEEQVSCEDEQQIDDDYEYKVKIKQLLYVSEHGYLSTVKRLIEENDVDPNISDSFKVCK